MPVDSTNKSKAYIALGFSAILALMVAFGAVVFERMEAVSRQANELESVTNEKTRLVFQLREVIRKRSFSLIFTLTLDDFFDRDAERQVFQQYERDYIRARLKLVALGLEPNEREIFDLLQGKLRIARDPVNRAMDIAVGREPEALVWPSVKKAITAQRNLLNVFNELADQVNENGRRAAARAARDNLTARYWMFGIGTGIFIISAGIAVFVIRRENSRGRALAEEAAERERAERNVRELNETLEARVKSRTLELTRLVENLEIAREESEAANVSKSNFLANMSHELRTPLNAIIGFSGTINKEVFGPVDNEKYKEYIRNIHESGEHLLKLINDILDLSTIEAGRLELHTEKLKIDRIADSSIRMVQLRAEQGRVHLINDIGDDLPLLDADERRVKQILVNLLSNAVKFTDPGGRVTLDARMVDGNMLAVSVSDTGIGMDEGNIERALTRFEQLDGALDKKYEGTGLGLPLTKELVKAHGGTFSLTSRPGAGTVATFRLPVRSSV